MRDEGLEHGVPGTLALGIHELHHAFERQSAVLERAQGRRTDGGQVLRDGARGGDRAAHHHGVHEVPDGAPLVGEVRTQRHGTAQRDVPARAVEPPRQGHDRAQQHERRDAVLTAHRVHAFTQLGGDVDQVRVALVTRGVRAGAVHGQVQFRGDTA